MGTVGRIGVVMEKLDKVMRCLELCYRDECESCDYCGNGCSEVLMKDALELLKTYKQRFYERSCGNCGNADYVHEYEIYLCRREDGCHWEPKLEE